MRFSCIIPAYNEWRRIGNMLEAALSSEYIDEIIVVNDGSTDTTREVLESYENHRLFVIHLEKNKWKLWAFLEGVSVAHGTHIIMLDADYSWFSSAHLTQMILPVLQGEVDSTMIMWHESLFLCKMLKHDIFSGSRVLPRSVFDDPSFREGKSFWLEAKINEVLYVRKLRVKSLYFPEVHNPPKWLRQLIWKQPRDILSTIPLWKIMRQAWYFFRQQR